MEDSNQLFQLDEDDIFSSDSFLEELEHAEKQDQISTTSEVNDQHLPLTKPHDRASDYKGYTFKSKVSPIIPATTSKSNDAIANNAAGLTEPAWDKSIGKYQTKCVGGSGVPSIKVITPQVNVTRIPSPLCRLRQGNNSQFSRTQHTSQELSNQKHPLNSECMKPSLGGSFGNHQGQTQKQQSRISGRHGHQVAGALMPEGGLHVTNTKVCNSSGNSRQPEATHYHIHEIKASPQVSRGAMTPTYRDCKGQDRRHDAGTPVPSTNLHRASCGTKLTPGLPGNLQTSNGCGQRGSPLANVGGTPSSSRVGPTGQYMTPRNLGQRREQVPGTALGTRQAPPMQQRQAPTPNRHTPGQGRTVLTPRVAQLCRSSSQGKGTGTVHGGTRKFPGPAGLLPKLCPGQKVKQAVVTVPAETVESNAKKEDALEEEVAVGDFEHGAWFRMKTELGIRESDPNSILQQNNIALVIRKASLKQLTKNKVTHLCVMLKTISINSNDASVTLCDPSGQMQGTIHRRLVEDHQTELKPGSVLVLRQVGVLSPSQRNHYLNITPSNLVQVFPTEGLSRPGSQKTPKRSVVTPARTPQLNKLAMEDGGSPSGTRRDRISSESRTKQQHPTDPAAATKVTTTNNLIAQDTGQGTAIAGNVSYASGDKRNTRSESMECMSPPLDSAHLRNSTEQAEHLHKHRAHGFANVRHHKTLLSSNTNNSMEQSTSAYLSNIMSDSHPSSTSHQLTLPEHAPKRRAVPPSDPSCADDRLKQTSVACEETKRPCLRDISCQHSNVCGDSSLGQMKPRGCSEVSPEIISDLLDGLEDELFEDF